MRAGIIIYNPNIQSLLLIHRIKDNRDYYVIPGGGQNPGETAFQTAQREIAEELGWTILNCLHHPKPREGGSLLSLSI